MGFLLSGVSVASYFGLNWDKTTSTKKIAQDVIDRIADRRVLNPQTMRPTTEAVYCLESGQKCRELLTEAITTAKVNCTLRGELDEMRSAFTAFVEAAGPDASKFRRGRGHQTAFEVALNALRRDVTAQAVIVARRRGVTCPQRLLP